MKAIRVAVALFAFCPVTWPQVPRDGSQQIQQPQTGSSQPNPSRPSTPSVEVSGASAEKIKDADGQPKGYQWHELYAPANLPGWFLFLVGGWAGWMALRTLKAIRDQTQAMTRSVQLQEVQYKQWVEVVGWKNNTNLPKGGEAEATLSLGFEIANTTNFPLTLKVLKTKKDAQASGMTMEYLIAPKGSYSAFYAFYASEPELALYRENNLSVTLSIETEIRDVLGNDLPPQRTVKTITFGPNRCEVVAQPKHMQVIFRQTT
jgi:hypothetical protein